jgi:hypothetical protein
MKLVILESPYRGDSYEDTERNEQYARVCLGDCIKRGESPIASHLLYTQPGILDDSKPEERKLGMEAGWAWYSVAQACVVYADYGISSGMWAGIQRAWGEGVRVNVRSLHGEVRETVLQVW